MWVSRAPWHLIDAMAPPRYRQGERALRVSGLLAIERLAAEGLRVQNYRGTSVANAEELAGALRGQRVLGQ